MPTKSSTSKKTSSDASELISVQQSAAKSVTKSSKAAQSKLGIDEIRTAFAALSKAEQTELLTEWTKTAHIGGGNSLTELVELVQKEHGANLRTEVWTEGESHIPTVYCKIILPDGTEYTASGKNQKAAKNLAASEALKDLRRTVF